MCQGWPQLTPCSMHASANVHASACLPGRRRRSPGRVHALGGVCMQLEGVARLQRCEAVRICNACHQHARVVEPLLLQRGPLPAPSAVLPLPLLRRSMHPLHPTGAVAMASMAGAQPLCWSLFIHLSHMHRRHYCSVPRVSTCASALYP